MDSKNNLIIEQVNINSCNNKKGEITHHLDSLKDSDGIIFCLNDTRLSKNKSIKVKGFKTIRNDHSSGKSVPGGVAILHKNKMAINEIPTQIDEMLIVELKFNNKTYRISTIYLHDGSVLTQSHFDALEKDAPKNTIFIIIGDMNAHCGIDKRQKIDKRGRIVNNLIEVNSYQLMNNDTPTYYASHKSTTSCIDLCLVKANSAGNSLKWSTGEPCGSDHVITRLDIECNYSSASKIIKKTNWARVREELQHFEPVIRCGNISEVDETIDELGSTLRAVVEKHSNSRKIMTRDNIALSTETQNLIKFRRKLNRLRKDWESVGKPTETTRRVMNYLNREIKRQIKKDVEIKTASKLNSLWDEKDAGKLWRDLKEMEPDLGKGKTEASSCGIFDANGILQKEDDALAAIHLNRLATAHSFPSDPKFDDSFKQKIDNEVANEIPTDATDFSRVNDTLRNAPSSSFFETERIGQHGRKLPPVIHDEKITSNELYHFLRKKKNKSAGGEDGINYKILKHAGKNVINNMAKLFTVLLVAGYFPIAWRSVRISMIPKGNKDLKQAKNWRPISLSSCMSKLFECSIKERIEKEKLKRKIKENELQAAYKRGRNCLEHVLRLTEDVTHGFANGECTVATFLDVAGAFDKVWINGLIWKILKLKLPKPLVGVIKGFLTERSLKVKVGHKLSPTLKMEAGTPQGAVLSPTLFNLFVDDLRESLNLHDVYLAQYADDIALWCTSKDPKEAQEKMNDALKKIAEWTTKWRIGLAPEKSVFMKFTRRPTQKKVPLKLNLLGTEVKQVSSHKFLGVNLDDRMEWNHHFKQMIGSATPRINALKRLAAKSIWQRPEWILKIHDAVVNSIWKYAAVVTCTVKKSLWDNIVKCHARSIKAYCGVPNSMSYERLCDTIGIKPIKQELMEFGQKRLRAIISFSPFGERILGCRRQNVTGLYKSPSEVLIDDAEATSLGQDLGI